MLLTVTRLWEFQQLSSRLNRKAELAEPIWEVCNGRYVPLGEQLRCFFGEIGEDYSRSGATNGYQGFHHHPLSVKPTILCGGLNHGVLP